MILRYWLRHLSILSLVLGITVSCTTAQQTIFLPANFNQQTVLTKENTIFAWDIHNVIVEIQPWKLCKRAFKESGLLWQGVLHINSIWAMYKEELPSDEYLIKISQQSPEFEHYIPVFLDILSSHRPLSATPSLLQELKMRGYKQYILSNIGHFEFYGWKSSRLDQGGNPLTYARGLKDKLPTIFDLFEGAIVAARKPLPDGFIAFNQKFDPDHSYYKVFVDDKYDNIMTAVAQGYIGILFISSTQVRNDCRNLGII